VWRPDPYIPTNRRSDRNVECRDLTPISRAHHQARGSPTTGQLRLPHPFAFLAPCCFIWAGVFHPIALYPPSRTRGAISPCAGVGGTLVRSSGYDPRTMCRRIHTRAQYRLLRVKFYRPIAGLFPFRPRESSLTHRSPVELASTERSFPQV